MEVQTVTVAQTQRILSLGATSVWKLLRQRRLTRVRVCGRTLVTVESIERLISEGIVAGSELSR